MDEVNGGVKMSCHDIGRGMNSVVNVVVDLYDKKKIEKEVAKTLIMACRKGVHWCDGNEYEATESIRRCRCGKCLEVVPEGNYLFSVWDVSNEVPDKYKILDDKSTMLASDGLCEKCFDEVINAYCQDSTAGAREREYILLHEDENNYLSEG